jgi:hypothetical protein
MSHQSVVRRPVQEIVWRALALSLAVPFVTHCGDVQLGGSQRSAAGSAGVSIGAGGGAWVLQGGRSLAEAGVSGGSLPSGGATGQVGGAAGVAAASSGGSTPAGGVPNQGGGAGVAAATTGGLATGGSSTGGVVTGGVAAATTGGALSGGVPSGGVPSGGVPSGGDATGGGGKGGDPPCVVQLGDANNDGKLDSQDSADISHYLLQGIPLACPQAADVNCDGSITGADVNCVYQRSQGLVEEFRCDFADGIGRPGAGGDGGPSALACGLVTGDVNGDGAVDINDAYEIQQAYVGNIVPRPFYWVVADVNCDGIMDVLDSLVIAQYVNGTKQLVPCRAGGGTGGAGGASGSGGDGNAAGAAGQPSACSSGTGGTGSAGGPSNNLALGDANGDGVVDLLDADLVAFPGASVQTLHPEVADVNCDCQVNLWDAKLIARYAQHAIDKLGCAAP